MKPTGKVQETRSINWQEAYARLERTRRALDTDGLPPEEVRRILRERAEVLARPKEKAQLPSEVLELLVFSLGEERYGVEPTCVLDVVPLGRLTPIPSAPRFILGVINHGGKLLPVLDLGRFLDPAGQGGTDGKWVVAVETGGMMFGIVCAAVAGIIRIGAEEIAPPPATLPAGSRAFIPGVTRDLVAILDLEALTQDPRIVVNEEVG